MSHKNRFNAHVLEGNWYDDRKIPAFPGARPSVETETAIRAAESE
jgi:hypothetical protein